MGALDWKRNSNILAVGSRTNNFSLYNIVKRNLKVKSDQIVSIQQDYWVNTISFSPGGGLIAIGDDGGKASLYKLRESRMKVELNFVTDYILQDSILFTSWSSDGKCFFTGG